MAVVAAFATGCSGEDDADSSASGGDSIKCCMLRELGTRCSVGNLSDSLRESVAEWKMVGNSKNAEACEALVDGETLGCSGPTLNYDEQDAIVDCS